MFNLNVAGKTLDELKTNLASVLAALGAGGGAISPKDAARVAAGSATVSAPNKKPKDEPADEAGESAAEEEATDPLEETSDEAEQPTLEDVRAVLMEAREKAGSKGPALIVEILKELGADNLNKLKPEKFATAIEKGKAAIAKHGKKK